MAPADWRAKLERDLGQRIDDIIWKRVVEKRFVADAELNPEEGYADLLEEVRYQSSLRSGRAPRRVESPVSGRELFGPEEQIRAHALYEYFAKVAASMAVVQEVREQILEGQLLERDAAQMLIQSPAAAMFTLDEFRDKQIPIVGHQATLVRYVREYRENAKLYEYFVFHIDPPGHEFGIEQLAEARALRTFLEYPGDGHSVARVKIAPASVLDWVKMAACALTERFPWEEFQAVWFLLTGIKPLWWPVRRSIARTWSEECDYQAITLVIEPWVSAEVVRRAYRAAQSKLLAGRENRPIAVKNLQLFRFCLANMDSVDASPDWHQLRSEWNQLNPDCVVADGRAMRRRYRGVLQQLTHPEYGEPW